jgi:hypothetical protein
MYYNEKITRPLAEFINDNMSYYEQHGKGDEVKLLVGLIDLIGDNMDNETDRKDWYSLCNTLLTKQTDENSIS